MDNPPHVYVWANRNITLAGTGQRILHAGGLSKCIEQDEGLAVLEHGPIRCGIDGVYLRTEVGEERIADLSLHLSERLLQSGITRRWFSRGWSFGNGVTCHKTHARYETKDVEYESRRTWDELLASGNIVDGSELRWERVHRKTEGWKLYEERWEPGTCPQFSHYVHLTWMVVQHELGGYGYNRIRDLAECNAEPNLGMGAYMGRNEPGKYLSTVRSG